MSDTAPDTMHRSKRNVSPWANSIIMTSVVHLEATIARGQQSSNSHRHEPVTGYAINRHGVVAVARLRVVRNVDMATIRGGVSQIPRATTVPMDQGTGPLLL
ncbi:hypothetical protein GN244_ATG20339 [Phytophthora infestans]|uniref:Uncharacterized protein n=1 Tax=Phytophthora infestans TaxID=4787 RepID=A0A833WC98_PHYIN|nr:hypothetical protein GN244_ATG20339 [Phytophthora infestans]